MSCPHHVLSRKGTLTAPLPKPRRGALEGWSKRTPAVERRKRLAKLARRDGAGTVLKRLNLLVNISADEPTRQAARADAAWLRGAAAVRNPVIADAGSSRYWQLRASCIRGEAREIGARYDRQGRRVAAFLISDAEARRNPEEVLERGSFTFDPRRFALVLSEYTNWRAKWWREVIQNAVDAGAREITCAVKALADGNIEVAVEDDGHGMDRETFKTKFFAYGGTGKSAESGATGGFGKAKELILLPWISWEVESGDSRFVGHNDQWQRLPAERPRRGLLLKVVMPADNATTEADALAFLKRCTLPGIVFRVNGTLIRADHRIGKEVHAPELEAVGGKLKVYHNASAEGPGIWVRKGGLFMFEKWATNDLKGVVTAEIQVPSTQILTANRDGFSDWRTAQGLDAFTNKLAADVISTLKRKKGIVRQKYIGTGKFRSGKIQAAALETLRAFADRGEGADQKGMARELVEIIRTAAPGAGEGAGAPQETAPPLPGELFGRPIATPAPGGALGGAPESEGGGSVTPAAILAMLEGLGLKGAAGANLEAIAKQVSWEPDFYLVNEIEGFFIPAKFKPETMAPRVRQLARFWGELCRFVLMQMGSVEEYGIGFIFDDDKLGAYQQETSSSGREEKWVLLNPYRKAKVKIAGGHPGEVYSLAKKQDLAELYAIAVHECTHLANQLPEHNEAFAAAFTANVAHTAGKQKAISAIRRAIVSRPAAPAGRAQTNPNGSTYAEAQYSTPSAREMIRGWLGPKPNDAGIERVARYLSRTLRVGGMRAVRPIVRAAAEEDRAQTNPLMHIVGAGALLLNPPACVFCGAPAPDGRRCTDPAACTKRARALLNRELRGAGLSWDLSRPQGKAVRRRLVWAPIALVMAATGPAQRLDLATGAGRSGVAGRLEGALAHFRARRPMTPPSIDIRPGDPTIDFMDGRHRLVAAWQLGARWAPFWLSGEPGWLKEILKRAERGGRRARGNPQLELFPEDHAPKPAAPAEAPPSKAEPAAPIAPEHPADEDVAEAARLRFVHDIPPGLAEQAYAGTSWTPEERGVRDRESYSARLAEDYELFKAQAKKGGTLDKLEDEFTRYRRGVRQRHQAYLASRSGFVSSAISGPSKYPAARMEKRHNVIEKRLNELLDWRDGARKAVIRNLRPDLQPIRTEDANATDRLEAEIAKAEQLQEIMREANAAIRKHAKEGPEAQVKALVALGRPEEQARKLLEKDFAGRVGFPDYALTNNSANIRRLKARLAAVGDAKAAPVTSAEGAGGVRLEDDPPGNRVRLIFPGKPAAEVREKLKRNGFRWAPSSGAWQAYRNNNSLAFAREMAGVAAA